MKKIYILDTSVCLTDYTSIYKYGNNDIVLPLKVLEEIDKHKKRQDSVGLNARLIIKELDQLRRKKSLYEGVRLGKGKGILKVDTGDRSLIPETLEASVSDHIIISSAIKIKKNDPNRTVIVVSRDINMRVICDSINLKSEDYFENQIIERKVDLYSGFREILVDDQIIDQIYSGERYKLDEDEADKCYPNQFLLLKSSSNENKTCIVRFNDKHNPVKMIKKRKNGVCGVLARNKEQLFAMELLLDPKIKLVTICGSAGSGKTLVATACGMSKILVDDNIYDMSLEDIAKGRHNRKNKKNTQSEYERLVVSRPVQPMGKDIGFLPGTMEEKMKPWLMPIQDNLEYIMGGDKEILSSYIDEGTIEIEALTYIRGRSISNAFMIIDEAQNLSAHEIKTIITRVGENTKIVLTGDIEQIDNIYIDETSNGLVHAIEKFKSYPIAGHITLKKGERSEVASLGAKLL